MNALDFGRFKQEGRKISMVTCYDHWSAAIIAKSEIDCVLVGDSLSMVVYGHPSTLPATPQVMAQHIVAVSRGVPNKFIIGDMPFLSFRKGVGPALDCVEKLMQAGAHAVKLEGLQGHEETISHIVQSGVPVMGHLGLTPQSIHQFGGFKVQAKEEGAKDGLVSQARKLEELGCFSLVLECVPAHVAKIVTESLTIPTIGIGAGAGVDGQVLVLQDLLGMSESFKPKFVRRYLEGFTLIQEALNGYVHDVKEGRFPSQEEGY